MLIEQYTATVIEVSANSVLSSTFAGRTPEEVLEKVLHHLKTEQDERDIEYDFDKDALLEDIRNENQQEEPFHIAVPDWDTDFYVTTKKIDIQVPPVFTVIQWIVTELFEINGPESCDTDAHAFPSREKAREYLREAYERVRREGSYLSRSRYPDNQICDGRLEDNVRPDSIHLWDEGVMWRAEIKMRLTEIAL